MKTDEFIFKNYFKNKISGIMVEVGSAGPEFLSQSNFFRKLGWRCICIEPNPKFVLEHIEVGNEIYQYACSNFNQNQVDFEVVDVKNGNISNQSFSSISIDEELIKYSGYSGGKTQLQIEKIKVNVKTLNSILEEAKVQRVDYVIVDVEGSELNVMDGFDTKKYNPKIIVLENNIPYRKVQYDTHMNGMGFEFVCISDQCNYVYLNKKYK